MFSRALDWLVGKWQWPYAALLGAGFLGAIAPVVFRFAGAAVGLVYLQLPIYMVHQYEEHAGDRFRLWVNAMIGHGREVLTPIATFWINSLLVWLLDLVALYLACFVDLSFGLIAIYLPVVNAFGHVVPGVVKRQYNPGLLTSLLLFLPVGVVSIVVVSRAAGSSVGDHLLAFGRSDCRAWGDHCPRAAADGVLVAVRQRPARGRNRWWPAHRVSLAAGIDRSDASGRVPVGN